MRSNLCMQAGEVKGDSERRTLKNLRADAIFACVLCVVY